MAALCNASPPSASLSNCNVFYFNKEFNEKRIFVLHSECSSVFSGTLAKTFENRCTKVFKKSAEYVDNIINPLNAELNPICHLLALLGGATIVDVSRLRVKGTDTVNYATTYHTLRLVLKLTLECWMINKNGMSCLISQRLPGNDVLLT
jgi:hypothetical protein